MRILVADDQELYRKALIELLADLVGQSDFIECSDYPSVIQVVAAPGTFDLIACDANMGGLETSAAAKAIRARAPTTPLAILSAATDNDLATSIIRAGAVAFVPKSLSVNEMRAAFENVFQGGIYLPPGFVQTDIGEPIEDGADDASEVALDLTPRQMEVLQQMARGRQNKQIAADLDIREGTVKIHVNAILKALKARNRTEAVYKVEQLGFQASDLSQAARRSTD